MKVTINNATLFLGDCAQVLQQLDPVDAVITDPPYGINENNKKNLSRRNLAAAKDYGEFDWDKSPPPQDLIDLIRTKAKWSAFFGGNYFHLPPTSCWLVWDKLNGDNDFADCELAWTNWPKAVRRLQWRWNGMIRQGNEERYHPTQKPLEVMKWVITLCPKADSVLDPFMGSGTTCMVCVENGRGYLGSEIIESTCKIAENRINKIKNADKFFNL